GGDHVPRRRGGRARRARGPRPPARLPHGEGAARGGGRARPRLPLGRAPAGRARGRGDTRSRSAHEERRARARRATAARPRGGPRRPPGRPGAVPVVRGPIPGLAGRVGVVFPRFSELAAKITIEPEVLDERAWVERAFAGSDATPEVALVGAVEPTAA